VCQCVAVKSANSKQLIVTDTTTHTYREELEKEEGKKS
jgi:hypothetical protein